MPSILVLAACLCVCFSSLLLAQQKTKAPNKAATKPQVTSSVTSSGGSKVSAAKNKSVSAARSSTKAASTAKNTSRPGSNPGASAKRKLPSRRAAVRRPRAQQEPTPERYREIQQALIDRGFLEGEPTGKWDAASVDALRRFQQANQLQPTGKIDALSLIRLGLGPKRQQASNNQLLPPEASESTSP